MGKKQEYKEKNEAFLRELKNTVGVATLPGGVLYKVEHKGEGNRQPEARSIVTVHYRGTLIDGRTFDDSHSRQCPEAFRLTDVIEGWQIALRQMHIGDIWTVYIPAELGYGAKACGPIPGNSTLIFEIELIGIG